MPWLAGGGVVPWQPASQMRARSHIRCAHSHLHGALAPMQTLRTRTPTADACSQLLSASARSRHTAPAAFTCATPVLHALHLRYLRYTRIARIVCVTCVTCVTRLPNASEISAPAFSPTAARARTDGSPRALSSSPSTLCISRVACGQIQCTESRNQCTQSSRVACRQIASRYGRLRPDTVHEGSVLPRDTCQREESASYAGLRSGTHMRHARTVTIQRES